MTLPKHSTKILGLIAVVFGVLQGALPQLEAQLSPLVYAIVTLFFGVAVTFLGRLRAATGGFLWSNKTTITGVLIILFSVLQGAAQQFEVVLSPLGFQIFTILVGVAVAVLGFLNSMDPPVEDGEG